MIKLSPRLSRIASLACRGGKISALADIGSDHGLIPAYLLGSGKADFAVITDISRASLRKAECLIEGENLSRKAAFVCADGIKDFPVPAEVIIIAGMGGMEIAKILGGAEYEAKRYILQPMKNAEKLRQFLVLSGYKIITDIKTAEGGKFYDIIEAEKGKDSLSEEELLFGRTNIKEKPPEFLAFAEKEVKKISKLLASLGNSGERGICLKRSLELLKNIIGEN